MKQILSDIGDLITGKSNTPPNPDAAHNVQLLQTAKQKVETGIFTKYFRRPYVVLMETVFYTGTVVLLGIGVIVYVKIAEYLKIAEQAGALADAIYKEAHTGSIVSGMEWLLLLLLLLPSVFSFLLARSYTKSRRRIGKLIEVEAIIDRVVYNLNGK